MSGAFLEELRARSLERIVRGDARRVAILGATGEAFALAGDLERAGVGDRVLGVFGANDGESSPARGFNELNGLAADLLLVAADEGKAALLAAYREHTGDPLPAPEVVLVGVGHLEFNDPLFDAFNPPALVPSYATGSPNTRVHLFQCLQAAARAELQGAIVEFGCFKGGTTAWLARVAEGLGIADSQVIGFDSWSGFPPRRSVMDLYEHPRCVFDDLEAVRAYTNPFGIELVAGDISETYVRLRDEPLLLCFFDTDNYSPTRSALSLCAEQLVVGGSIVFDHVATTPEYVDTLGERVAAYEVLASRSFVHLHGTGVFTKIA